VLDARSWLVADAALWADEPSGPDEAWAPEEDDVPPPWLEVLAAPDDAAGALVFPSKGLMLDAVLAGGLPSSAGALATGPQPPTLTSAAAATRSLMEDAAFMVGLGCVA